MERQERQVYRYLKQHKASAAQITLNLFIGDARSVIRRLRSKGVKILDEWKRNKDNTGNYKLYWIDPKDKNPEL